jgi:hypothetical protein
VACPTHSVEAKAVVYIAASFIFLSVKYFTILFSFPFDAVNSLQLTTTEVIYSHSNEEEEEEEEEGKKKKKKKVVVVLVVVLTTKRI